MTFDNPTSRRYRPERDAYDDATDPYYEVVVASVEECENCGKRRPVDNAPCPCGTGVD